MVNVGSLPGVANVVFDLDTHAGVMSLLASIRVSKLTPAEKNEIRDLVFLYTNGGKEQTVRRALEQKILAHNIAALATKEIKSPSVTAPVIGKYRAAPSFSVSASSPTPVSKPVFTAAPAWKHEEVKSVLDESVFEASAAAFEPTVAEVPATVTSPISVPEPTVAAAPVDFGDTNSYLQRIREIKALVNEKVGNPVNLVDINNEVGREYMGALLDAMKKINSGSSAASAMKRLEEAYTAVEVALKAHGGSYSAPEPLTHTIATPITEVHKAEPVMETPVQIYENTTLVASESKGTEPVANSYEPVANPVAISRSPEPVAPVKFAAFETTNPVSVSSFASPAQSVPRPVSIEPLGTPSVPPPHPESYFSSLADYGEKSHTTQTSTIQNASQKTPATAGDPLMSAEVDDGLQQLLSEWSIYKKSGLFGTGPKGREHPLFKKMAPLQIPLLLAGRFEGATQEVKQSVTDYMNGWRYEQGLIYQQNETFEHYLRRVIRHILDLQKG